MEGHSADHVVVKIDAESAAQPSGALTTQTDAVGARHLDSLQRMFEQVCSRRARFG